MQPQECIVIAMLHGRSLFHSVRQTEEVTSVQVRLAGASSAFVGERYAVVCEVLDQCGRSFNGDPKCGSISVGALSCLPMNGAGSGMLCKVTCLLWAATCPLSGSSSWSLASVSTAAGLRDLDRGCPCHGMHERLRCLCRLTANLTDDAGAALFAAEVGAMREEGLHEVSFTPRISGALLGCRSCQTLLKTPCPCTLFWAASSCTITPTCLQVRLGGNSHSERSQVSQNCKASVLGQ